MCLYWIVIYVPNNVRASKNNCFYSTRHVMLKYVTAKLQNFNYVTHFVSLIIVNGFQCHNCVNVVVTLEC